MPQSLALNILHIVFSTKDRQAFITTEMRPRFHAYLATVARNADCEAYRVGGVADHVHLAVRLSRTIAVAQLIEQLKTASSKWIKAQFLGLNDFAWQRGYACFSVGPGDLNALIRYIDNQEKHHRGKTFQDELRTFLGKYEIEYNENYIWD